MTCPTCTAQIPDTANFCPSCGRLVRQANRPQEAGTQASVGAPSRTRFPTWLLVLIIAAALFFLGIPFLAIFAAILIPNFIHAKSESEMVADQANLKQIAVALEEYAVDHNTHYPRTLMELRPTYLTSIPEVPGSGAAYAYRRLSSRPKATAYQIWDDGSMDPTTFGRLKGCFKTLCKYVVYVSDKGVIGMPDVPTKL